jgi:hypothetical protein
MQKLSIILSQYPDGQPFYEFDIDDQTLSSILQVDLNSLTGVFSLEAADSGYFIAQIGKFTGKLETDKVLLYVCSDCGDFGCGALTAKISFHKKTIVWSDFVYENTLEIWEKYPEIGPYEFDRAQYENEFQKLTNR